MPELKFRAWDHFNSVYYYSDKYDNLAKFFTECQKCIDGGNKITFQQFTGLKDKNGVEIYEGDIVSEPCHDCENWVMISEMVFERGAFDKKGGFRGCMTHTTLYGEVIGNIYESPELLEQS